jgi:glutaredoxin 3
MFCERTKEYLSQKGIPFIDRDVTKDESALEELKRLHAMTTPVTLIGTEVIIGFDPEKIDQALSQSR